MGTNNKFTLVQCS